MLIEGWQDIYSEVPTVVDVEIVFRVLELADGDDEGGGRQRHWWRQWASK